MRDANTRRQVLTKKVGRVEEVNKGQTRDDSGTCDATHGNQGNQSNFRPRLQLQMPDEESRDNGKGEIGDNAEDTVHVAKDGDNGIVNALSLLRSAVPHV